MLYVIGSAAYLWHISPIASLFGLIVSITALMAYLRFYEKDRTYLKAETDCKSRYEVAVQIHNLTAGRYHSLSLQDRIEWLKQQHQEIQAEIQFNRAKLSSQQNNSLE